MSREEIFNGVKEVLKEYCDKEINENTSIVDELGLDSLDIVEMLMALEEKFDVTIEDSVAEGFNEVKDVIDYIENAKK